MIVLVAPEPAAWIAPVAAAALRAGPVVIFAPWALPPALTALSSAAPLRRRALTVAPVRTLPGWIAVEALARLWSRSRTDRQMRARFALRGAVDALAARWLPRGCEVVIAPALAARRTFAEAIVRGAATVLVEDLPSLRALHADLDAAAARHPAARFLGHFRASPAVVAAQEAERVLARCVLVRSHHARSQHGGRPPGAMLDLPTALIATTAAQGTQAGSTRRVLLAGLAAPLILVDGAVVGTWAFDAALSQLRLRPALPWSAAESAAIDAKAEALAGFIARELDAPPMHLAVALRAPAPRNAGADLEL